MADYGASPTIFTLANADGSGGTYDFNGTGHTNKITLLTYIDITKGWTFLDRLISIQNAVKADGGISNTDFEIVAVVFNYYHYDGTVNETHNFIPYSGMISPDWIADKIDAIGPSGIDNSMLHVVADSSWSLPSPANINDNDYHGDTDSPKPTAGTFWWGYLIGKDFTIADKFEHNTSGNRSFNHIDLSSALPAYTSFNSTDYDNLQAHIIQRVKNLINPPFIIDADPINTSTVSSLNATKIFFSKPVNNTEASNAANYDLDGGGFSSANPNSALYNLAGNAENAATLTITAALDDTTPDIDLTVTGINDTVPATSTPAGPQPLVTAGSANLLEYVADVTGPAPSITCSQTSPTNISPLDFSIDFGEVINPATFTEGEIGLTNCTIDAGTFATTDNTVWTFNATPTVTDDDVTVSLSDDAVADIADPLGNLSDAAACTVRYDFVRPTVSIAGPVTPSTTSISFDVTVQFDEVVTGFTGADLDVTNGTAGTATTTDNEEFTVPITASGAGDVIVALAINKCTDIAGNQNQAAPANYTIEYAPVVPSHKQVVLCMDYSDSMNWDVVIDSAPAAPKITYMLPAIQEFITQWDVFNETDDEYGLVWYKTSAAEVVPASGLQPFNEADLQSGISGLAAGGSTAMGAGLGISLDMLNYDTVSANTRAVVLFADGQDNVPPMVQTTGTHYTIPEEYPASGFPVGIGDITVNATDTDKVPIYTIGIGNNGTWLGRLSDLSTISGGIEHATLLSQIWPLANDSFQDILLDIYGGNTPQLVFRKKNTLPQGTSSKTETFTLNRTCTKVMFCVSWPGTTPVKMTIKKGNTVINDFAKIVHKERFSIVVIEFPHFEYHDFIPFMDYRFNRRIKELITAKKEKAKKKGFTTISGMKLGEEYFYNVLGQFVRPAGQWSVSVKRKDGSAEAPFNLSVVADETSIRYHFKTPDKILKSGLPFELGLWVTANGKPLETITEAKAVINAPHSAYGNVIAAYSKQINLPNPEKLSITDRIKLQEHQISKIPEARAQLTRRALSKVSFKQVKQKLKSKLINDPGRFSAPVQQTRVPGIYRIDLYLKGYSKKTGAFERQTSRTVVIRPNISIRNSIIKRHIDPETKNLVLDIIPKDVYGNYVGPGFSDYITSNFTKVKKPKVEDHLDGSYTIRTSLRESLNERKKLPKRFRISLFKSTIYKEITERLMKELDG